MKKGKLFAITMGILLSFTLILTACGGAQGNNSSTESKEGSQASTSSNKGTDTAEKPVLKFAIYMDAAYTPTKDMFIFKEWGNAIGAVIDPTAIPADSYRTKLVTLLSSGDIPDVLVARAPGDPVADIIDQYGPKGIFLKINKNWDKLPNVRKYFDKYPDAYKVASSPDGNIYGIPYFYDFVNTPHAMEMRADLLRKGGIDYRNIETIDDLTNALRVLKKENGGKSPLSFRDGYDYVILRLTSIFGTSDYMYYDNDKNKFEYGPFGERYKFMLETLKSWYAEGLLHKDFATMEDQVLEQLFTKGDVTARIDNMGWDISKALPGAEQQVIKTPKINGKRYGMPGFSNIAYTQPYCISSKTKYPDKVMAAIDYLYSEEGVDLVMIGKENVTWKKDPSSNWGGTLLVKAWQYCADDPNAKPCTDFGIINQDMTRVWLEKYGPMQTRLYKGETNVEWLKFLKESGSIAPATPEVNFTPEEMEQIQNLSSVFNTFVDENTLQFIQGTKDIKTEWDSFISNLKGMQPDKVEKIYNDALKRYLDMDVASLK